MGKLNTYLLKKAAISIGGLIVFACCVLLMERLLRIFEVVSNSTNPAGDATTMIVNLLPYYLIIAVPMALLLGTIITVDRFSRSSELTAAYGSGFSLFHMTKPFVLIAIGLSILTIFIEGYMQPVGRYNYRKVENAVKQRSFTAALREGTFTQVGNRTFHAGTDLPGAGIGPIFIHEIYNGNDDIDPGFAITTATQGQLIIREETNAPVLQLDTGRSYNVTNAGQLNGDLGFGSSAIAGAATLDDYRIRGDDEREMTSLELFANRKGGLNGNVDQNVNNSTLHLRLARSFLLLILPFIAVPFGINYGRNPSSAGIFVGVVFLVSLQKALEFAQSLGAKGVIPPWLGIWGLILMVCIFAALLYRKSAFKMGQPPLSSFSHWVKSTREDIVKWIKRLRGDPAKKRVEMPNV